MPAATISQSILVNQGLGARLTLDGSADAVIVAGDGAVADVVGSFKKLAVDADFASSDATLSAIFATFGSPLDLATFFINAKYAELGSAEGVMGRPISAVAATAGSPGYAREFQNGTINWHPLVGAHGLHGPIWVRWDELGGAQGFLGFPTSDVTAGNDIRAEGAFASFQGGSIYWAPLPVFTQIAGGVVRSAAAEIAASAGAAPKTAPAAGGRLQDGIVLERAGTASGGGVLGAITQNRPPSVGACVVYGAIREKYLALGAEASILGYPRSDEIGTPDGIGRFNQFQGGAIYWTPGTGAHEVHGLIHELWANGGAERNPQLGYPLADEFIPDARVGYRRPEATKKPILSLPADVIKLPAEAASAGFPSSVVNTPLSGLVVAAGLGTGVAGASVRAAAAAAGVAVAATATGTVSNLERGAIVTAAERPADLSILTPAPASSPAKQRSANRFADFESGVLFWFRGSTTASVLTPLTQTSDGTSLSFSGADIAAIAIDRVGRTTFEAPNAHLTSVTFAGTTGYMFDGAQVHNRRHRLQLILLGTEVQSIGPLPIPLPVTATVETEVEVWFDPSLRQLALTPTAWSVTQAASGSYRATIEEALHARLDPLLWRSYELLTLPDTDAGAPIAVLSVKTLENGAVAVFVEPQHLQGLTAIGGIANAVPPAVLHITPHT